RGWVFTDTHLTKMANTFMDKVAICAADSADGLPTTAQRLDGSGVDGTFDLPSGMWDVLAPWNPRVHRHLSQQFTLRDPAVQHGYTLSSIAQITCAEQQLS